MACSKPTFNPFWVGVIEQNGALTPAFTGAGAYKRRQDVPAFFRINGALYLWRRDHVLTGGDDWSKARHLLLEMSEARALSIDDLYEFQLAEAMIEKGLVHLPWISK
jgi:CMP-N-acetylneuraminic acid synthetase